MGIQLVDYHIEYELPFLRGIYNITIPAENKNKAIELFNCLHINAEIRKISTKKTIN